VLCCVSADCVPSSVAWRSPFLSLDMFCRSPPCVRALCFSTSTTQRGGSLPPSVAENELVWPFCAFRLSGKDFSADSFPSFSFFSFVVFLLVLIHWLQTFSQQRLVLSSLSLPHYLNSRIKVSLLVRKLQSVTQLFLVL